MKWEKIEQQYRGAAAGSFLVFAAMLIDWGVELPMAVKGLRVAYAMKKPKKKRARTDSGA